MDWDLTTDGLQSLTIYLEIASGDTVELSVLRDGQELTIPVVLSEQPR